MKHYHYFQKAPYKDFELEFESENKEAAVKFLLNKFDLDKSTIEKNLEEVVDQRPVPLFRRATASKTNGTRGRARVVA